MRPQHLGNTFDTNIQQRAPIAPFVAVADASAGHLEETETFLILQFLQRMCQKSSQLTAGTAVHTLFRARGDAELRLCQCTGHTCF